MSYIEREKANQMRSGRSLDEPYYNPSSSLFVQRNIAIGWTNEGVPL